MLDHVVTALESVLSAGQNHAGLVPSMLDIQSGELLRDVPETLPGQRPQERAPGGTNLLYDVQLLRTMYGLGDVLDRPEFVDGADSYLDTFTERCTDTATGLFAWGDHAYWHLVDEEVSTGWYVNGSPRRPIHDHGHHVPRWVWDEIHERDPSRIHRFADGLTYHWSDLRTPEYNRHAFITVKDRYEGGDRSCDFPRHSGHYVYDWTYAYTKQSHPEYLRRVEEAIDYWWERTDLHVDGVLPLESRGNNDAPAPGQTLSLAISLLDSKALLEDAALAPDLREYVGDVANAYLDAYLELNAGTVEERILSDPIWAAVYGGAPPGSTAATEALKLLCAYRHTERDALLEWAETVGTVYANASFPAEGTIPLEETPFDSVNGLTGTQLPVWAFAPGQAIGLLTDLYDITGDEAWKTAGERLADDVVPVYWHGPMPRAAGSVDYYENQLGSGYLIYNLARLGVLSKQETESTLPPDYTAR